MLYRAWRVPVTGGDAVLSELNAFAVKHRILELERRFVEAGLESFWAIWVSAEPLATVSGQREGKNGGREQVDYREVLSSEDFSVYARLRSLRKRLSDQEGVPVFAIFNNRQLAQFVTGRISTASAMRAIPGVGSERMEKYGDVFLAELKAIWAEKGGTVTQGGDG